MPGCRQHGRLWVYRGLRVKRIKQRLAATVLLVGCGWHVEPNGEVVWAIYQADCIDPPTSSSLWRRDGLHAQMTPDGELVFETDADDPFFGCR